MPLIRRDALPGPAAADGRAPAAEGSAQARWEAARGLEEPKDVQALIAALESERDVGVRQALLTRLARSGAPEAIDALISLVRGDDAAERAAALDALRTVSGGLDPRLPALVADPDPDVRLLACELARGAGPELACKLLAERLESDPSANVCAAAIEVLAEIGTDAVLPALDRCAARFASEPFLRFAAAAARARISSQAPGRRG